MTLFNELKRRNVFRVAIAYLVIAWLLALVSATLENALNMPVWFDTMVVCWLLIGFPIALFFSWVFELIPKGVKREKGINRDDSVTHETSKKLNYVTILVALAVLVKFSWKQLKNGFFLVFLEPNTLNNQMQEMIKMSETLINTIDDEIKID